MICYVDQGFTVKTLLPLTNGSLSLLRSVFGSCDTSGSHILLPLDTTLVVNLMSLVSFLP